MKGGVTGRDADARDRAMSATGRSESAEAPPVAAAIHSLTTPKEGGSPGQSAAAHQVSAATDHLAIGPSSAARTAIARSLPLTISSESEGALNRDRIGST